MDPPPDFDTLSPYERRQVVFEVRDGCWCRLAREFWDEQAIGYADRHLDEVERREGGWEIVYQCPRTEIRWVLDRPLREEHGGGPARLRRMPH